MIRTLNRLFEHDQWSGPRTLASVRAMPEPSARCLTLLAHIVVSRQRWLDLIDGLDAGAMNTWPQLSIDETEALGRETDARLATLLARLDHSALENRLHYTNASGQYLEFGWGDALLHSFMHSQYHRAQVASEVRALGGTPASTDYIVLCRDEFLNQSSAVR